MHSVANMFNDVTVYINDYRIEDVVVVEIV